MEPNKDLENPQEDYVPPLDAMVQAMGRGAAREVTDDWGAAEWSEHHEALDQEIRDSLPPPPEKRPCFKCGRWVSFGINQPEGEDPRCPTCNWQVCICGACRCNYGGPETRSDR